MMDIKKLMDNIYKSLPVSSIPWNNEVPPDLLLNTVNKFNIKPCKAIDIGCGIGNYSVYLASLGFDMTGIDISDEAIRLAELNAMKKGISCNFRSIDMLEEHGIWKNKFDFAFDYEVLHHIFPDKRNIFIKNVYNLLNKNAKYLSVCVSEKDKAFGGKGKLRKTPLDTELYFSSENELKSLFESMFNIIELKTVEISGKTSNHLVCYCFMERIKL